MLNPRRRNRHTLWKVAFMAVAAGAVALFLYRYLSPPADIRAASWDSVLGLPNATGDCLGKVQYGDVTGDGVEEALVLVKQGCGDATTSLWLFGQVSGQRSPLWGADGEPALVLQHGTAALTPEGNVLVRDADPESPLNRAGLKPALQADRGRLYALAGPESPVLTETWHDPILLGQVTGTGGCLNVRAGPSTGEAAVGCVPDGESLVLVEGPIEEGSRQWWARAGGGWVAGDYLTLSPGPNPERAASTP